MKYCLTILAVLTCYSSTFAGEEKSVTQLTQEHFQKYPIQIAYMQQKESSGISFDMLIASDASGAVEAKVGVTVGSKAAPVNEIPVAAEEGWGMTVWNTVRSPFYLYRFDDGMWFPEWREHPWRTSITTLVYAGIGVALGGGHGGGGGGGDDKGTTTATTGGSSGGTTRTRECTEGATRREDYMTYNPDGTTHETGHNDYTCIDGRWVLTGGAGGTL